MKMITSDLNLASEWRFYKDGNAWFCEVVGKKKTVFGLSIWEGYIRTSFFFTGKNSGGIDGLAKNSEIKNHSQK